MYNKENIAMNYSPNYPFQRSPLKDFPLKTFNFIFSSHKKCENIFPKKNGKKIKHQKNFFHREKIH